MLLLGSFDLRRVSFHPSCHDPEQSGESARVDRADVGASDGLAARETVGCVEASGKLSASSALRGGECPLRRTLTDGRTLARVLAHGGLS